MMGFTKKTICEIKRNKNTNTNVLNFHLQLPVRYSTAFRPGFTHTEGHDLQKIILSDLHVPATLKK